MSKQREREEFIVKMTREGVPVDVARLLLRHAATLQRIAELECSTGGRSDSACRHDGPD